MAHPRKRLISPKLLKKLSFFPILAIQGARQTGKSYLVKSLLKNEFKGSKYITFDNESDQSEAERTPRGFLQQYYDYKPLIIDEAQKVPKIFDALKFEVDENRKPNRFIILGSTEFSLMNQIRESLTGRMGKVRVYPLTLRETLQKTDVKHSVFKRSEILRYLKQGGMPGFFYVHDEQNQHQFIEDWVNLVCYRDLHQFKKLKLDSNLALKILSLVCTLEEPNFQNICKKLRVDSRKVKTHLTALQELFVLYKLEAHPSSFGRKSLYFILDPAVAGYFGATTERKLHITLLNERFVYHSIHTQKPVFFYYYRSSGKNIIHLVEEETGKQLHASLLLEAEATRVSDLRIIEAFKNKNPGALVQAFAPCLNSFKLNGLSIHPWEDIFKTS